MSISCDKCKEEGTPEDPIFYLEAFLKGTPILETIRDMSLLEQPQMIAPDPKLAPCTIHLHRSCAAELYQTLSTNIANFLIPPEEKPSGKKKAKRKQSIKRK